LSNITAPVKDDLLALPEAMLLDHCEKATNCGGLKCVGAGLEVEDDSRSTDLALDDGGLKAFKRQKS